MMYLTEKGDIEEKKLIHWRRITTHDVVIIIVYVLSIICIVTKLSP